MTVTYPELSKAGRLGNQLWEIAATIGIAVIRDEDVQFPRWDYQPYFCVPDRMFVDDPVGTLATEYVSYMDPRARAYLQDAALVSHIEPVLREYFLPSTLARGMLDEVLEADFAGLPRPWTSVHVRRGDNVTHPLGFHPLRSAEYYRNALASLPTAGSLIVFSDDPDWCEENFERDVGRRVDLFFHGSARPREYADRVAYETAPVLDWVDVQLMAGCDRHVISNSTYAWWGAFLSTDRHPVYPSNWYGWNIRDWTDASLMFPPNWREIFDPTQGGV